MTDLKVEFSDQVKAQIERDPKLAEAMRDFAAQMKQGFAEVAAGRIRDMDTFMRSMGATPVSDEDRERLGLDD